MKPKKEEKNIEKLPKQKKADKNKILKAYKRQNLLNSDPFVEKYSYQPRHNELMKLKFDSNYNLEFL